MKFLGIDLGWYGKPSGVACLRRAPNGALRLHALDRLTGAEAILAWIDREAPPAVPAVIGVDAPVVIPNLTGGRPAEALVTSAYGRYHAGCHAANLARPFAALTTSFSDALSARGFAHLTPRRRCQIEVHPHAATIELFGLPRIVKYKKGTFADRARELARLRGLMLHHLPALRPPLVLPDLPEIPARGLAALKNVEDRLDAVLAAYVAAHWWQWGEARNRVFGTAEAGYIVVPRPAVASPYLR